MWNLTMSLDVDLLGILGIGTMLNLTVSPGSGLFSFVILGKPCERQTLAALSARGWSKTF
jgi:hypothetical protein